MDAGSENLREQTRRQLLASLGGWSGTVAAAIPPVVFVIVNAISGLRAAVIAAVLSAVVVAGYRLIRRQPVQQALMGLLSVAVAAAIAARTGQARGFFLLGIAGSFAYGAVFLISLVLRRPLIGVIWEFLDPAELPEGRSWREVRPLLRAYDWASLAALAMFTARGVVQLSLFQQNRTGWLAVARLAMGYPLYIAVVGFAFWIVRRARSRVQAGLPQPDEPEGSAEPRGSAGADGLADGGLRFGQRDEQ